MDISERIQRVVERLPAPLQIEALDFIEYLLAKAEREAMQERKDWSDLSLNLAMRGMEDEETPLYTMSDLKVVF
jgi:hypothetical protein